MELDASLPDWTESQEPDGAVDYDRYAAAAGELAAQDPTARRDVLERYSKQFCLPRFEIARASGLYVVLRLLFRLPTAFPLDEAQVFGGWLHPSMGKDPFDLSWPVAVDEPRRRFTVDRFRSYRGKGYDAIGEYDYFAERFPLRPPELLVSLEYEPGDRWG
jgi:hypothetical protein